MTTSKNELLLKDIREKVIDINDIYKSGDRILASINKLAKTVDSVDISIAKRGIRNGLLDKTSDSAKFQILKMETTSLNKKLKEYIKAASKYRELDEYVNNLDFLDLAKINRSTSKNAFYNQINSYKLIMHKKSLRQLAMDVKKMQRRLYMLILNFNKQVKRIENDNKFDAIIEKIDEFTKKFEKQR